MSKLLLDEQPLIILPKLAVKIGLNEAIILQQLHYWLERSANIRDGERWVYNTQDEWVEQFPFWSKSTVRRIFTNLENKGLVITRNYNKLKIDQTKWYRIDYKMLESLENPVVQSEQMEVQSEQTICSKWSDGEFNLNRPLPEITTEITTTSCSSSKSILAFYQENFGVLNPFVAEGIEHWVKDTNEALVLEAMKRALKAGKKWNYAEGILRRWVNENITNVESAVAQEIAFQEQRKQRKEQQPPQEPPKKRLF